MDIKAMREKMKADGHSTPRSNEDLIEAYNRIYAVETPIEPSVVEPSVVTLVSSNIYTYIGQGDSPPHLINFMGRQQFVRGTATEVTDPAVLAKIDGNGCFVKGQVDQSLMFERDEEAKKKAQAQREQDQITNLQAMFEHA